MLETKLETLLIHNSSIYSYLKNIALLNCSLIENRIHLQNGGQFFDPKKTLNRCRVLFETFSLWETDASWDSRSQRNLRPICASVASARVDTAVLDDIRNRCVREDKSGVESMNFWLVQCDTRTHFSDLILLVLCFDSSFFFFLPTCNRRCWGEKWSLESYMEAQGMGKWLEDPYGFVERNLRLCNLDKCEINLKQIGYEMTLLFIICNFKLYISF